MPVEPKYAPTSTLAADGIAWISGLWTRRHSRSGSILSFEVIGALRLSDSGSEDYKILCRPGGEKLRIVNLVLSNSIRMIGALIPQYRKILAPLAVMKREVGSKIVPSGS